ncbi:3240_t:CDS:2 [Diversispora eburnea]|uniref:3240_t:CDS:1 n=1 Tax=Diversispora eburnea TaxID=1213867 RepID=A0A9N8ZMX9_9GLOM|nr:3240_t:CDS:2 [Diversispora eburnea]
MYSEANATMKESNSEVRLKAKCYHCDTTWARGKPLVMKAHLANICKSCPDDISIYWRDKLLEQAINYTRTSKQSNLPHNKPTITQHFGLNPGYAPPSRKTASERFLDEEVARINKCIDQDLENAEISP